MAAKHATTGASRTVKTSASVGLAEGDALPDCALLDQDGNVVKISSFRGSKLVLYFYPKDDTPGCTKEACSFQENLSGFRRAKAKVVGISADSSARHRKFADKYGLAFPLLVDEGKSYASTCGVIGEKVLYGKTSLGVIRTTFVVDREGKIFRIFRKVKVDGHTEAVLAALQQLG